MTYARIVVTVARWDARARAILAELDCPHRRVDDVWTFQPASTEDRREMDSALVALLGWDLGRAVASGERSITLAPGEVMGVGARVEGGAANPGIGVCPEGVDWSLEPAGQDLPYRTDGPGDRETWSDDPWWMGYGAEGES